MSIQVGPACPADCLPIVSHSIPIATGPRHVVLLVDDDPSVLAAFRRMCREESFEIETTDSPRAALERLRTRGVGLLAADYRMPEMCGVELLEQARTISPRTRRILLTAFAGEPEILGAWKAGLFTLHAKPWEDRELRRSIREHLRNRELEDGLPLDPPETPTR